MVFVTIAIMTTIDGAQSMADKFNKKQVWTTLGKWVAQISADKPCVTFVSERPITGIMRIRLTDIAFGYLTALGY